MIRGWKKLTKKELEHLKDSGVNNTELFQRQLNLHAKFRKQGPAVEPCWDCVFIADKLGMVGDPEGVTRCAV